MILIFLKKKKIIFLLHPREKISKWKNLLGKYKFLNLKKGVKLINKKYETEASGGVNLKNVKKIASTGVKRISVGQITHSAPFVNFKLEI